jgi:uncharacterized membrane protein
MTLLVLLSLLVGPYMGLVWAARRWPGLAVAPPMRFRVGASLLFAFTAMGHFFQTAAMAEMLPPVVPYWMEIIYLTGILELLGAVGLWVPGLTRLTGLSLCLMLVGVLPTNVYAAFNSVAFGGHEAGPIYLLVRVPFQLLPIWWIYKSALENPRPGRVAAAV